MSKEETATFTTSELTEEHIQYFITCARKRQYRETSHPLEQELPQLLWVRICQAAELLKTRFGAKRVWLFGSLAHQAWFSPDSDVDLAVEGLNTADYWAACQAVEDILVDREVDLIEVESASASLLQAIQRYGKLL